MTVYMCACTHTYVVILSPIKCAWGLMNVGITYLKVVECKIEIYSGISSYSKKQCVENSGMILHFKPLDQHCVSIFPAMKMFFYR
jgi:hypothetical protein